MEKKIITQAERTKMFNEWLSNQPMPELATKEERQRWWINKVIEFDKITSDDFDIVPGFYVDATGNTVYPEKD